jgi:hypothetical protein
MKSFLRISAILAVTSSALAPLHAQGLYFGLRGGAGIPTGSFNENVANPGFGTTGLLDAAKTGFGYGADAGLQMGMLGVYGGFDHINFDCQSTSCNTDGKYRLQGLAVGVKLIAPGFSSFHPWVKGGVTFNELEGGYGSGQTDLTTDRKPGYEVGVGLDIPILGLINITPQARYVGQNFKYKVPGVTSSSEDNQGVNYITFDLGLSVHNPLSGLHR